MKLWELFSDRVEEGALSREQFREILAKAVSEFEAQPPKHRYGSRRRGHPVAPVEPAAAPDFDIVAELPDAGA